MCSVSIWVSHRNAVLRHGIVSCLRGASLDVAGSGAGLRFIPDLGRVSVLVFDADGRAEDRAALLARGRGLRLVGLLGNGTPERVRELQHAGLSAVLDTATLTPTRLLGCIEGVERLPTAPRQDRRCTSHGAPRFTPREVDVLRLLADGASTRDIALELSYSERTVKTIVHDVLTKLRGRTRAHAVAVAARSGVI